MRALLRAALVIVVVYSCILSAALAVMYQPPERFGNIMARVPDVTLTIVPFRPLWFMARGGRLQLGDSAPPFALPAPDKTKIV
jgi:hypothetical protein